MNETAEKNFFSFRMVFTIFYWIVGTAMMVWSLYADVSVFWGLAVVAAGTTLLIASVIKDRNEQKISQID